MLSRHLSMCFEKWQSNNSRGVRRVTVFPQVGVYWGRRKYDDDEVRLAEKRERVNRREGWVRVCARARALAPSCAPTVIWAEINGYNKMEEAVCVYERARPPAILRLWFLFYT